MRKGVILEINEGYLTMLTSEGEFLRARNTNQSYQIGEEIDFFPMEVVQRKTRRRFFPFAEDGKAFAAAALSLMLLMISFIPFYQSNKVYAYISIDVNPSIEIGFNDDYKAVKLTPYNEEGKKIIDSLGKWKKQDVSELTEKIIAKIKENGYLNENRDVVLATVLSDKKELEDPKLKKELNEIKQNIQKEKVDLTLLNASVKEREEAKEQGMSAGVFKEKKLEEHKLINSKEDNQKGKNTAPGQMKKEDNNASSSEENNVNNSKESNGQKGTPPGLEKKNDHQDPKKNNQSETSLKKSNGKSNAPHNGNGLKKKQGIGKYKEKPRGHFPYKYPYKFSGK